MFHLDKLGYNFVQVKEYAKNQVSESDLGLISGVWSGETVKLRELGAAVDLEGEEVTSGDGATGSEEANASNRSWLQSELLSQEESKKENSLDSLGES